MREDGSYSISQNDKPFLQIQQEMARKMCDKQVIKNENWKKQNHNLMKGSYNILNANCLWQHVTMQTTDVKPPHQEPSSKDSKGWIID